MAKKVLVVEDYADIRRMMAIFLKHHGYDVIEASDGYEAVEMALEQRPDIVLMDISMPVLDGIYSIKAIRDNEELAGIPIVALTAYGDAYDRRARDVGCNEVLQKAVDFQRLDAVIQQHLH